MKKFKGFTLNELLITISIITIMSAVTFGAIQALRPYWSLSGGTREMMFNISRTQEYSVSQQVIHKITVSVGATSYQIIKETDTGDEIIQTIEFPESVSISDLSPNITGGVTKFNFMGAPLDSINQPMGTAQITLTNHGRTATIEISPAGNVSSF